MSDGRRLLAFALGTFHAVLLTLALLLPLYLATDLGEALADLNTAVGLGAFAVLWATSVFCADRGLVESGVQPGAEVPAANVLRSGLIWGLWNGLLFLWVLLAVGFLALLVNAVAEGGPDRVFGVIVFAVLAFGVGTVLAAVVGAAGGIVFAALDILLQSAARAIVGAGHPTREDGPVLRSPAGR